MTDEEAIEIFLSTPGHENWELRYYDANSYYYVTKDNCAKYAHITRPQHKISKDWNYADEIGRETLKGMRLVNTTGHHPMSADFDLPELEKAQEVFDDLG